MKPYLPYLTDKEDYYLPLGSPTYDHRMEAILASDYGDPEAAMIQEEERVSELLSCFLKEEKRELAMVRELLQYLSKKDAAIIYCHLRGETGEQIGERVGRQQVSISYKVRRIFEWIKTVLPLRLALEDDEIIPDDWTSDLTWFYHQVIHRHQPYYIANPRYTSRVKHMLRSMRELTATQQAIAELLTHSPRQWSRPPTRIR